MNLFDGMSPSEFAAIVVGLGISGGLFIWVMAITFMEIERPIEKPRKNGRHKWMKEKN